MRSVVLVVFASFLVQLCEGQCRRADWWGGFDQAGWVTCDASNEYLDGLFRNDNWQDNDGVFLIEEGECCKASAPYQDTPSNCVTANWWAALDSNNNWAVCPAGYFMHGMYRGNCHWLYCIEEAKCCKPNLLPNQYGHCYDDTTVATTFDDKGLTKCNDGYYMVGIFRGGCDKLYCIERFRCCQMYEEVDECQLII